MNNKQFIANRLVYDKEKMRVITIFHSLINPFLIQEHELHMSRLRSVKSMLDTKAPKQYNHLSNGTNAKTKQLMSKYMEM